eukprot:GSChrysophyteH2.ASY1.ANO1.1748.1 assembled CDS
MINTWLSELDTTIGTALFPSLPIQYTLRKRLIIHRSVSPLWAAWDTLQMVLITLACGLFIASVYDLDYTMNRRMLITDLVVTQFFLFDFMLNWYMHPKLAYWADFMVCVNVYLSVCICVCVCVCVYVDLASMLPVYLSLVIRTHTLLDFLKCLRVLRLVSVIRNYKPMHNVGGVTRQVVHLVLLLFIMTFLSSCVTQFLENNTDVTTSCVHIGEATNWEPSCSRHAPPDSECQAECVEEMCFASYGWMDAEGRPGIVRCSRLNFFDAFWYIIITLSTIGYGDIRLRSNFARAQNILFIFVGLVLIPMRISELQVLLSLTNPYAKAYTPQNKETHIIITGYLSDKKKLETFLKEFFHPDRVKNEEEECRVIILASHNPSEDIRSLLFSSTLESKVGWVIGSPLSITDLKKVRAESARAMFFLVNTNLHEAYAKVEDASNVLSALSVTNYNSNLLSFVQVLRPENGDILQDSDVDMILCLDEYKTAVQARNALCPGFSTFVENIFHSMGNVAPEIEATMPPWYDEYLHGAAFLKAMRYRFRHIVEVIFCEWECITLGMCRQDKSNIVMNPLSKDLFEFLDIKDFYSQFSTALILADDQHQADEIERQLKKPSMIYELILKVSEEEDRKPCGFPTATPPSPQRSESPASDKSGKRSSGLTNGLGLSQTFQSMGNIVGIGGGSKNPVRYDKKRFRLPSLKKDMDTVGETVQKLAQGAQLLSQNGSPSRVTSAENEAQFDTDSCSEDDENFSDQSSDDDSDGDERYTGYIGYTDKMNAIQEAEMRGYAPNHNSRLSHFGSTGNDDGSIHTFKNHEDDNSHGGIGNHNDFGDDDTGSSDDDDYDDRPQKDQFSSVGIVQLLQQNISHKPGSESCIVKDANSLSNHIVLIAAESNILMFVQEVRRKFIMGDSYHPVLIVLAAKPASWNYIQSTYNDIYLMIGDPSKPSLLKKMNFASAYSVALMGNRESMSKVDGQTVNTGTLFTYLKAESFVPASCFLTVELTSSNNMSVLNATIMRRHRDELQKLLPNQGGKHIRGDTLVKSMKSQSPLSENANTATLNQLPEGVQMIAIGAGNSAAANIALSAVNQSLTAASKPGNATQTPSKTSTLRRRGSVMHAIHSVKDAVKGFVEDQADRLLASDEALEELWDAMDSYHVLPVFASAKAFVPSSFESLLVQSYYVKLTPVICEKFVCGQLSQTMMCVELPKDLVGFKFIDLFRLFIFNQVVVLGLYRGPMPSLGSTLSYVYTSPPRNAVLHAGDRVYVYGTNANLDRAKQGVGMCNNWNER